PPLPTYLPAARPPHPLLSVPTRRSSDLCHHLRRPEKLCSSSIRTAPAVVAAVLSSSACGRPLPSAAPGQVRSPWHSARVASWQRSEEHTSELQSRFDLVCRLLLEKKKKT